jgi:cytoskeletal protein CcmA (bactofilin family)
VKATDKIEIRKDASLVGDIRTPRIIIEDGLFQRQHRYCPNQGFPPRPSGFA